MFFHSCTASEPDVDFAAHAVTSRYALVAIGIRQEAAACGDDGGVLLEGCDSLFKSKLGRVEFTL